jgi:hypothetical protein
MPDLKLSPTMPSASFTMEILKYNISVTIKNDSKRNIDRLAMINIAHYKRNNFKILIIKMTVTTLKQYFFVRKTGK